MNISTTDNKDLSIYWEIDPKEHRDIVENIGDMWDKSSPDFTLKTLDLSKACAICRWYNNLKPSVSQQLTGLTKKELLDTIHSNEDVKSLLMNQAYPFWTSGIRRFTNRFSKYKKQGWRGLISDRYGNANQLKVKTEPQRALIRQLYGKNQDYHKSALIYNEAAELYNWPAITNSVVKQIVSESEPQVAAQTTELKKWHSMFNQSINRKRPSQPGYMWGFDGWDVELFFQEEDEKTGKIRHFNRLNCVFVIDYFNDTIMGVAAGYRETSVLISQALRNAVENTGIIPWQIQSDRFAKKALGPLLEALAWHVTPAQAYNARAKAIEPFFQRFKEECVRNYANWSGSSPTSKLDKSQPNREFIVKIKENFPDRDGNLFQIAESIEKWNTEIYKVEGKSRYTYWLEHLQKLNEAAPKEINTPALIDMFGVDRTNRGKGYKYDAQDGLDFYIKRHHYKYKIWDSQANYLALINKTGLLVRHLPDDLSQIKVINPHAGKGEKQVFYIKQDELEPMCIRDYKKGDQHELKSKMEFQKSLRRTVIERNANDLELLQREAGDAFKLYLTPVLSGHKHHIQDAENTLKQLDDNYQDPYEMDIEHEINALEEATDIYEQEIPATNQDSQ